MKIQQLRRIDLSAFQRVLDKFQSEYVHIDEAWDLSREYQRELANLRRQAMLAPVPVNGNRALGRRMGYFCARARDGGIGYMMRRTDDCLQAAIASVVGIPAPDVPDLHIDEQRYRDGLEPEEITRKIVQTLDQWSDQQGFDIRVCATLPTSGKWIGVVPVGSRQFTDHCLCMSGRDCIFDPAQIIPPSKHDAISAHSPDDIEYAITIERT